MILVVGSTGAVGASVVRRLSAKGKPVAALVRDPASEKARALERQHISAVEIQAARAAAGDPMTASFLGLCAGIAGGDEIPADGTRTLGVQPTSLEDWIRRSFGARSGRPDGEA